MNKQSNYVFPHYDIDFSDLEFEGFELFNRPFPIEIEHYCFACAPTNPIGLKMKFYFHPEKPQVITKYILPKELCGFPGIGHGGISTTLLDEVMAYASFKAEEQFGLTRWIKAKFLSPVPVEKQIWIEAHITNTEKISSGLNVYLEGKIWIGKKFDDIKRICVKAEGCYYVPSKEKLMEMLKKQKQSNNHKHNHNNLQ